MPTQPPPALEPAADAAQVAPPRRRRLGGGRRSFPYLLIGPALVFMLLVHVLPMLGEERVEQRAVDELAGVEASRGEEPAIARLKGDARVAEVIAAMVAVLPQPPSQLLAVRLEGIELRLSPDQVAGLLEEAHARVVGAALTQVDARVHGRSGYADAEVYHPRYSGYFRE